MMRRFFVVHDSLRVVVHRDEEVFIAMNERRVQFRKSLASHILIILFLVTVSSLWNAIFCTAETFSASFTLE